MVSFQEVFMILLLHSMHIHFLIILTLLLNAFCRHSKEVCRLLLLSSVHIHVYFVLTCADMFVRVLAA